MSDCIIANPGESNVDKNKVTEFNKVVLLAKRLFPFFKVENRFKKKHSLKTK